MLISYLILPDYTLKIHRTQFVNQTTMYALYKLLPVSKKTYLNLFNMLSRSGSSMFVVKKLFLPR